MTASEFRQNPAVSTSLRKEKNAMAAAIAFEICLTGFAVLYYGVLAAAALPDEPADEIRGDGMLELYIALIAWTSDAARLNS